MRAPTLCRIAARILVLAAGLAFLTTSVEAGKRKKKKKKDDDTADVAAIKDKLEVYTDGEGGYFVVVPGDSATLFYGDGKTLYKQRVGSSGKNGTQWSMRMWSPRVEGRADLVVDSGKGTMSCGDDDFDVTLVDATEGKKIIAKAAFKKHLWKRQSHSLFRDDRGTYYYVDRMQDDVGGKGFRLFAGAKGGLKELPLTNIVSDSQGQIFSSKRGELRFIQESASASDARDGKASWIKGEQKTELTTVPIDMNVSLIYGELGVYEGSLGTPCDEY